MGDDASVSLLQWLGNYFYVVMIAYVAGYLALFLRPLSSVPPVGRDLKKLRDALRMEVDQASRPDPVERRRETLREELAHLDERVRAAGEQAVTHEAAGERDEAARYRTTVVPDLERQRNEAQDALRSAAADARRAATLHLTRLEALRAPYSNPLVTQAVTQLRTRFPRGDYTRLEVDALPAICSFNERLTAARTMAGVFVLLGLLGTFIKLNGVVGGIGVLTGGAAMEPAQFLDHMGGLMGGVGGAFNNSIAGLLLMVLALVYLGRLQVRVQREVAELDTAMFQDVVPSLVELHERYMPDFTLADLLKNTGEHLDALNGTVGRLTTGMGAALVGLEQRIGEMLQQFGSFQRHYVAMDDLVKMLRAAAVAMEGAAGRVNVSATRLATPVDEMNEVLRKQLELQLQAQAPVRVETILHSIWASLETARADAEARNREFAQGSRTELLQILEASRAQIDAAGAQSRAVEHELAAVSGALREASNVRLGLLLDRVETGLITVNQRLESSAGILENSAGRLGELATAPTFFAWITQRFWPALRAWIGRLHRSRVLVAVRRQAPARSVRTGGSPAKPLATRTRDAPPVPSEASPEPRVVALPQIPVVPGPSAPEPTWPAHSSSTADEVPG